jgi:hypothetical protein
MPSARTAIFCSLLALEISGCAQSPAVGADPFGFVDPPYEDGEQGDDDARGDDEADDDLDGTEDAVRVDDDDDDDKSTVPSRDAGLAARGDASADASTAKPNANDAAADAAKPALHDGGGGSDAGAPSSQDAAVSTARDGAADAAPAAQASTCTAGTYRGPMNGDITGGLTRARITGTVTMVLTGSGSTLQLQSGTFEGKDGEGHAIKASVSGSLNCTNRKLESGALRDGVYAAQEGLVSTIRFTGAVAANFSSSASSLSGTWTLESALRTRSGSGTFSATLQ